MGWRSSTNELEVFSEDLAENMQFLVDNLHSVTDLVGATAICEHYEEYGSLSNSQLKKALEYWREAQDNS